MSFGPPRKPTAKKGAANSSQQIVVICIFIVGALICFMLGVLVGRVDRGTELANPTPTVRTPDLDTSINTGLPDEGDESGVFKHGEGVQTSPRRVELPDESAKTWPEVDAKALASPDEDKPISSDAGETSRGNPFEPEAEAEPAQDVQEASPPEAAAETDAAGMSSEPADATAQELLAGEPPWPQKTTTEPTAETLAQGNAQEPEPTATPAASEAVSLPEAAPPAATAAPAAQEAWVYGIQVASFAGSQRQKLAEDCQRSIEANSDLKAQLSPSEDGEYVRVIVGGYADKAAAAAACQELRKRAGFKDCFVKSLR